MMKALIVEDEYLAREELTYLIQTHSHIHIEAAFEDGLEAFKFLQTNQVDIVFLDINIPSIDGMLLARNISQFKHKPHIVFTTAYKDHAVDAFELEAFDYLLKPISETRMKGLLAKLELQHQEANQQEQQASEPLRSHTINLMKDNRIVITPVSEIDYAEANEKITTVYTADGCFIAPMAISELVAKLPQSEFFRCHRSYCINLSRVQEIIPWVNSTYMLKLQHHEQQVPVSRSNIKQFRERMKL
ncbi:LytR/AlgR family response regulator transcription factor [Photobacterium angustum]|nr:LytTR family DNA-binding domain-containing protein [Photobacterium angustum]KJF82713.1 LytTR family transcriptional regulator [Photobacterium damselae subsp. damselae]KJG18748.1 LytTR family transcriptional regulator [Photobacterium angustum]KJG25693.1 LytTR family transcriptional regulator [Photobacterium angustum]KJG33877.1 LytTR family transcriptional regulator [Photobacterium angustum]KJG34640.1 LytTR family transcriptional regulator [Photobacterium angustum]